MGYTRILCSPFKLMHEERITLSSMTISDPIKLQFPLCKYRQVMQDANQPADWLHHTTSLASYASFEMLIHKFSKSASTTPCSIYQLCKGGM